MLASFTGKGACFDNAIIESFWSTLKRELVYPIGRFATRDDAAQGGHDVPEDKIVSRYHRVLENLRLAIPIADRIEVYDNSREGRDHRLVMTFARGRLLELEPEVPRWAQRTLGDYLAEGRLERTRSDREALGRLGYPNAQASGRFEGAVRLDEQNTPIFPLRNAEGKTVAVLHGEERIGDERGVWSSTTRSHDTRLVITHSPQEALAHAELNRSTLGHTRYLAVEGREAQHGVVERALSDLKPDAQVIIAVPDTAQGRTLAARLFELTESQSLSASRASPRANLARDAGGAADAHVRAGARALGYVSVSPRHLSVKCHVLLYNVLSCAVM